MDRCFRFLFDRWPKGIVEAEEADIDILDGLRRGEPIISIAVSSE